MKNCIFCKIVKGNIPAAKIWEDNDCMAFLDLNPNTKGMTLVITKQHYDSYLFDMPDKIYQKLMVATKKVAKLLEKALGVHRVAMVMEGTGVNHIHIKIYPMHGLMQKNVEIIVPERKFFEKYPGYVTTLLGPQADFKELNKLAEEIKKHL